MCNVNGVKTVMQNVFAERKDWKKALAIGTAGAVGLGILEDEKGVESLMQNAGNFISQQLGEDKKIVLNAGSFISQQLGKDEKGVQNMMQNAGKFVSQHLGKLSNQSANSVTQAPHAMTGVISAAGSVLQAAGRNPSQASTMLACLLQLLIEPCCIGQHLCHNPDCILLQPLSSVAVCMCCLYAPCNVFFRAYLYRQCTAALHVAPVVVLDVFAWLA
jgi:hypothetical protein